MVVVVLSVTPERLRGVLTRWLLEIATGVYVGHLSARVRQHLWARIQDDVGRGRAIMVWTTRNEQRLAFQVHNHAWIPVDYDGFTLMRRPSAKKSVSTDEDHEHEAEKKRRRPMSNVERRRRYKNAVEQRHASRQKDRESSGSDTQSPASNEGGASMGYRS
ncbi:MAG: type I-E CRISPR-associated endoribonuclease Cas2e [Propionibacteriaceae bacterium]|jgi:CRISPR-associated protein Cas2|nr:type I-E CRISPR-associated endoribonuclease Cas2e [Propionibacteriaceae bacterium]